MVWFTKKRVWLIAVLAGFLALGFISPAGAAEIAGGDEVYRLPADEVISDDLYVGASEIYIDGTVEGDLVAAAGYIEVNGTVTGDAILAGAGINISGEVQDDVRAAGAGVDLSGTVGDDLFATAGGGSGFAMPIEMDGQTIEQGIHLTDSAQVGGDAFIAGGEGDIAGTIDGRLNSSMGSLVLAGFVGQDARLYTGDLRVDDAAQVEGTLEYSTNQPLDNLPAGVAANVEYVQPEADAAAPTTLEIFWGWLWRTLLILIGFSLVGWLILRLAPKLLTQPADALTTKPVQAGVLGVLAGVIFVFIPLASALLVLLMILFWGWFPGIVLGLFLFGSLALVWVLSPLVTGLWLGRWFNKWLGRAPDYLPVLLGGVLLLALLGRIPIFGWLVYLVSFLLALGGLVLARRTGGNGPLSVAVEERQVSPTGSATFSQV